MTYKVSRRAALNLVGISEYIAEDNPTAAREMMQKLWVGIEQLVKFPQSGRMGAVDGTRELVIVPYRITYRIKGDVIYIFSVIHDARRQSGRGSVNTRRAGPVTTIAPSVPV